MCLSAVEDVTVSIRHSHAPHYFLDSCASICWTALTAAFMTLSVPHRMWWGGKPRNLRTRVLSSLWWVFTDTEPFFTKKGFCKHWTLLFPAFDLKCIAVSYIIKIKQGQTSFKFSNSKLTKRRGQWRHSHPSFKTVSLPQSLIMTPPIIIIVVLWCAVRTSTITTNLPPQASFAPSLYPHCC